MFDRETKAFLWFVAFMLLIVLPIVLFGLGRLENRIEQCHASGGIAVKLASDGWACIDVKVLK